jgi:glutamyl-tRNA reductase
VASGLDSQIVGDDQIITQAREALESSRGWGYTDSFVETMFRIAIQAAKAIKTRVILKTLGTDSVPAKAVEKLKKVCAPHGMAAVVIGNGQMGRLVASLLIKEGFDVTVTLREYKKGVIQIPENAQTINYSERYRAIERADIVVSATSSPHYTVHYDDMRRLPRLPGVIVDLAVPRDVEPSIGDIPGTTLLTIDDLSGDYRDLPDSSIRLIDEIISEHIGKFDRWRTYKTEEI